LLRRSTRGYHPSLRHLEAIQNAPSDSPSFLATALDCDTGNLAEYHQLLQTSDGPLCEQSAVEEWACLALGCPPAGIPITAGTDTLRFINPDDIPAGRHPTYPRIVVADRPQKTQPRRVRLTVGGDRIDYPGDVATKTSSLPTIKLLLNSTISTPGAQFMTIDIKDFYLNTPMHRYEYMRVNLRSIPQSSLDYYNLLPISRHGTVYVEIHKGMYGLPQAARLANDGLVSHLSCHGYLQDPHTPGLFTHTTRPIAFCLVVDDFGIRYTGTDHADHLIQTLKLKYTITVDWSGDLYVGLTLKWNYEGGILDISMPGYVDRALARFQHPSPTRPQHSPFQWIKPVYGTKSQLSPDPDTSAPLLPDQIKRLQQILGVFLYYARAVDSTMLVALGTLAAAQTCATAATNRAVIQFLDYAATHPTAIVRFHASPMILHIHSDASYLSESKSRSRAGGIFFLAAPYSSMLTPALNGAVHITSLIMKHVLASAAEAEIAALFHNAQEACSMRVTLTTLGHPQSATPIQTDNQCALGIVNGTVKQKRSRAIDMRFYWLCDRVQQNHFLVHWAPGPTNRGDYFTKHHPTAHHLTQRSVYLHQLSALP
jgi:hypothetical protein